ncbi:8-amino-7-oxononanoate synthase [Candidatus Margulisiibacteriota bacterium]
MDKHIDSVLNELQQKGLLRTTKAVKPVSDTVVEINGQQLINFSSNNYLGLAMHPEVITAAKEALSEYGAGSGASRLICGTTPIHEQLERKLAEFKHTEAALVFPAGYMANVGTISAILDKNDAIVVDKLNHASIIDGARLSGAKIIVYPHRDTGKLNSTLNRHRKKYNRLLIVTDSLFSMDGDIAPLPEIVSLARHYDCLTMVDEAHATGVFGTNGEGLIEHFGLSGQVDVVMGTLSKAIGSQGGYIAGTQMLIDYLVNKCRSFIYTTALPASACAAALKAIEIIEREPERRKRLWENIAEGTKMRELLKKNSSTGIPACDYTDSSQQIEYQDMSQIVPIIIGDTEKTVKAAEKLYEAGFLVLPIRPPTVPEGTSRLRISISSEHTKEDIRRLVKVLNGLES